MKIEVFDSFTIYGDKYNPAMQIREQADADKYFEELVAHCMSFGKTREEAERIERSNLGYWAGYCDDETRERVERLFHCAHPVFGATHDKFVIQLFVEAARKEAKKGEKR